MVVVAGVVLLLVVFLFALLVAVAVQVVAALVIEPVVVLKFAIGKGSVVAVCLAGVGGGSNGKELVGAVAAFGAPAQRIK